MKVPFIDLKALHNPIQSELISAAKDVINSQIFIGGRQVELFERQIAEYCNTKHAIGVSSGTDAILACLMAEDIGPGDEVVTTPYTFIATADVIVRVGATPVFADIDPLTFNISTEAIQRVITDRTKAIIPVDLFGQPCEISEIMRIAKEGSLIVIEDAAQAIGAVHRNMKVGSIADYTCFSFFPTKNLGGFGDGGMITTEDDNKAAKLRCIRQHGGIKKHCYCEIGGNFRLDSLQAALLNIKLKYLTEWNRLRLVNAVQYHSLLARLAYDEMVVTPVSKPYNIHVYNQYVISASNRDRLKEHLNNRQVATEIYYPLALHLQKCFGGVSFKGRFSNSEDISATSLALPIHPNLSAGQIEYVVKSIEGFYEVFTS